MPCNTKPQFTITAEFKERVKGKLVDVRRKGYFGSEAEVKSLTHFFPVPKIWKEGEGVNLVDGIRMAYDATQSKPNAAVWTSWFAMPTINSHLRAVEDVTFMADCDVGEICSHAGVDISKRFPDEGEGKLTAY